MAVKSKRRFLASIVALIAVLVAIPLDGEIVAKRLYFHFYANNRYDPTRSPFVVSELPFSLTVKDFQDIFTMVDEYGNVRSETAIRAVSADHFMTDLTWSWIPQWARYALILIIGCNYPEQTLAVMNEKNCRTLVIC